MGTLVLILLVCAINIGVRVLTRDRFGKSSRRNFEHVATVQQSMNN